jgi:hypothetical protein
MVLCIDSSASLGPQLSGRKTGSNESGGSSNRAVLEKHDVRLVPDNVDEMYGISERTDVQWTSGRVDPEYEVMNVRRKEWCDYVTRLIVEFSNLYRFVVGMMLC